MQTTANKSILIGSPSATEMYAWEWGSSTETSHRQCFGAWTYTIVTRIYDLCETRQELPVANDNMLVNVTMSIKKKSTHIYPVELNRLNLCSKESD
jgi:hypothetical protein